MKRSGLYGLVGVLVAAASTHETAAEGYDKRNYCNKDGDNVVIFVDVTTPYDATDKSSLIDGINKIFSSLAGGERIAIRTIADAFTSSERLVDECVPYCPSGGFFSDLMSDCTAGTVISDKKHLAARIAQAISRKVDNFVELKFSEILRTLVYGGREIYRPSQPNRIYIFSDMIENSNTLRTSDILAKKPSQVVLALEKQNLIADFSAADVHVFGFGRSGNPAAREVLAQDKVTKLEQFWHLYFQATGAKVEFEQNLSLTQ